eukprot:scaffold2566_cov33-Tisochrysis_lutea.AAC.1
MKRQRGPKGDHPSLPYYSCCCCSHAELDIFEYIQLLYQHISSEGVDAGTSARGRGARGARARGRRI